MSTRLSNSWITITAVGQVKMAKLYTVITSLDCANTPMDTPEPPRRHKTVSRHHAVKNHSCPKELKPKELKSKELKPKEFKLRESEIKKTSGRSSRSPALQLNMAGCTGCSSTEVAARDWNNCRKRDRSNKRQSDSNGHSNKTNAPFVQLSNGNSQNRKSNHSHRNRSNHSRRRVTLVSMKPSSKRSSSSLSILGNGNQDKPNPRRAHSCGSLLDSAGQDDRLISEDERLEQALASTMLQQILRDMYIEPELLAELDEEQKQVLFCRMREEQVRKWKEKEDKLDSDTKDSSSRKPKKPGGKNKKVDWLVAKDGSPWVWVMGEHENDRTIEDILEEETQNKASQLAEEEAGELRRKAEEEEEEKMKQEEENLRKEAERRAEELREAKRLEEERKRLEAEKESQAREEARRLEEQQKEKLQQIKRRHELQRRQSIDQVEEIKNRRSMEIYSSFKETRRMYEKQAEENGKLIEEEWQEQERKAKAAENERREIARRAREEHRRSIRESFKQHSQVIGALAVGLNDKRKPDLAPNPGAPIKARPPKPADRQAIVDWFREVERPKGSGYDTKTKKIAPWFHGIISRQAAEDLLQDKGAGTFLLRVSERIWGYAISYKGKERCKHFLIDTSDGTYQFFGTNQISHNKLADLVHFHKARPISTSGQEKLLIPCLQQPGAPDYSELFAKDNSSVL